MALHIILSYKMVVSSQIHTLATKPQRKTVSVPKGQEDF